MEEIEEWQERPLDDVYPFVFIDAVHFSVKEDSRIVKKAAYIVLGINDEGFKDILGIWIGENESAKYWLPILKVFKYVILIFRSHVKVTFYSFLLLGKLYYTII